MQRTWRDLPDPTEGIPEVRAAMNNSIDPNKEKQRLDVESHIQAFFASGKEITKIPAGVSGEVHKAGQVQLRITSERAKHEKIKRALGESV